MFRVGMSSGFLALYRLCRIRYVYYVLFISQIILASFYRSKQKSTFSYPLLILSTNSSGVSISIFEKPNHFLPKSLMDAPM